MTLAVVGLVVARVRVLLYRFARHAVPAVDPPGKILKLAALAAEGNPGCLGELAPAKQTRVGTDITIDLKI
jgi:hypothetical protein